PGEYLDLLGIDILTNAPFRTFELTDFKAGEFDLQQWLRGPRVIALTEELARAHRLRQVDGVEAQLNGRTTRLTIGYLLRTGETRPRVDPHFAAIDLGWAQEL